MVLGMTEAQGGARGRREGKACKDAIIFYVVYIHQMNVKILHDWSVFKTCHSLNTSI